MPIDHRHDVSHFSGLLGVRFMELRFEEATCLLNIKDEHRNMRGGVHGGVIFSLADIIFEAACDASGESYVGLQADIRYIQGGIGDVLYARAVLVGSSRKFAHYQIFVTDGTGNTVALFTSSAYKLRTSATGE